MPIPARPRTASSSRHATASFGTITLTSALFALVATRERAVDFYEELLLGMEGALPEQKLAAINAAKDRGEVPEGYYHRLDVYRSMSNMAAALPAEVFDGPNDRLFEFDADAGAYVCTAGAPP
jgi:hypothetical protein